MAQQSRLEKEGIQKRSSLELMNDYMKGDQSTEYSANHKDAQSDGDAKGKGVGSTPNPYLVPNANASKTSYTPTVRTDAGGSSVDINKRNELLNINIYSKDTEYGPNSVDTSQNIANGQYFFKVK